MAAETMTNIRLQGFTTVSRVDGDDCIILTLSDGNDAKMTVGMFQSYLSSEYMPSINDGVWWIGSVNTGISAVGYTPEYRRSELGIEYRYPSDPEGVWTLLVPFEDIKLRFDDLTPEQKDEIRLKFSDLTPEDIAELQRPALDMKQELEEFSLELEKAESARVKAEETRAAEHLAAMKTADEKSLYATQQADYAKLQGEFAQAQQEYAKSQGDYAKQQADYAKTQGTHAKTQGDYAKEQGTYAREQGDHAKQQGDFASAEGTYAHEQGYHALLKGEQAKVQAEFAKEQGGYALAQGDYAKQQGDYAKSQAEIFEAMSPDIMLGKVTTNPAGILD